MGRWEQGTAHLRDYLAEHGNTRVPRSMIVGDGFRLGNWVHRCRTQHRLHALSADQVTELDALGFHWRVLDREHQWAAGVQAFDAFAAHHGHRNVPADHITPDGFPLGTWIQSRKAERQHLDQFSAGRRRRLEQLDLPNRTAPHKEVWQQGVDLLRDYSVLHGDTRVPSWWHTPSGFPLGRWVDTQRVSARRGNLPEARRQALDHLGFEYRLRPSPDTTAQDQRARVQFEHRLEQLRTFLLAHGHLNVPRRHNPAHSPGLGTWVARQRRLHRDDRLSPDRVDELRQLGLLSANS